jgi:hypothetical protein
MLARTIGDGSATGLPCPAGCRPGRFPSFEIRQRRVGLGHPANEELAIAWQAQRLVG